MRNTSGELLEMFLLHVSKKNEMGNSFGELLEMPGRFSFASCSLEMGFVTLVPILCLFVSYFVLLLMERRMGSSLVYYKTTCTWCYSYTQEAMHPKSGNMPGSLLLYHVIVNWQLFYHQNTPSPPNPGDPVRIP